ncbi:hypothetical protein BGZ79_007456 [Entomortierella chlamydospora]|nr:hypothetical protein BGZ79_007456 [Entomortierella chlamydospora]
MYNAQYQQNPQYQQGGPALIIYAHGAQDLQDVETLGKQDPYLQFSLDFNNPKSFQKTFVHKNAGKTPVWNQTFTIPLTGEPELYVEVMDEEAAADAVIAFAAIPINQVVHAPGGTMNGLFDVFTPNGKAQGVLNLTLTAQNVPGQNTQYINQPPQPVRGTSHINEGHQRRAKSLKNKETASDVGTAALGGLLAVGAGLLVNKLVNDHKKEEETKLQAQAEREKFELEKKRLEEERINFQRQQQQYQQQQQQQQQHQYQPQYQGGGGHDQGHHGGRHEEKRHEEKRHDSDSSSDSDSDSHKKKKGKKWDKHGHWYSPGDKVKYDGSKYICLQGHNSQPDWAPNVAHSLWRED